MLKFFRILFYRFILKPLVYILLGLNVRQSKNLPKNGPCIIVSNHNSHLDTVVLMTLFPTKVMLDISPIAAADCFLKTKFLTWFSKNIFNIIPLDRRVSKGSQERFYEELDRRIKSNSVVILYPEGSRGEPDRLAKFKSGIAHIAKLYPEIPIIPVFMEGLGMSLPKGELLLVPVVCNVFVEKPLFYKGDKAEFMRRLKDTFEIMQKELKKGKFDYGITSA